MNVDRATEAASKCATTPLVAIYAHAGSDMRGVQKHLTVAKVNLCILMLLKRSNQEIKAKHFESPSQVCSAFSWFAWNHVISYSNTNV